MVTARQAQTNGLARSSTAAPAEEAAQELGPLEAGASSYVDGSFVWTDYVYDDRGAESDGRKGGDATSAKCM